MQSNEQSMLMHICAIRIEALDFAGETDRKYHNRKYFRTLEIHFGSIFLQNENQFRGNRNQPFSEKKKNARFVYEINLQLQV